MVSRSSTILIVLYLLVTLLIITSLVFSILTLTKPTNASTSKQADVHTLAMALSDTSSVFLDTEFKIYSDINSTREIAFDCSWVDVITTRTFIVPNNLSIIPSFLSNVNVISLNGSNNIAVVNNNTLFGIDAGLQVTTGTDNSLLGFSSGSSITSGSFNICAGNNAGASIVDGSTNLCFGSNAVSDSIVSGSGNIICGYDAQAFAADTINSIVIGNNIIGQAGVISGNGDAVLTIQTASAGVGFYCNSIKSESNSYVVAYDPVTSEVTYCTSNELVGRALTSSTNNPVTFSLSGSPTSAVFSALDLQIGWSGVLSQARGGFGSALTPSGGGVVYGDGANFLLSVAGSSGQLLISDGTSSPTWTALSFVTSFGSGTPTDTKSNVITTFSQTKIGLNSLSTTSTGSNNGANTVFGSQTLADLTDVSGNISNNAYGYFAGALLSLGSDNVFAGHRSGAALTGNAAIQKNIFIGSYAGGLTTSITAAKNIGVGYQALGSASFNSSSCIAFGDSALLAATTGTALIALGNSALLVNTTGSSNIGGGVTALSGNATGSQNSVWGYNAQSTPATSISSVTAFGFECLLNNTANTATAFGAGALRSLTSGTFNSAFGYQCLFSLTTGSTNTAHGYQCGYNIVSGTQNTMMGVGTLMAAVNMNKCAAVGYNALNANQSDEITAIGVQALETHTTGLRNTAFGFQAMRLTTTATDCSALGYKCLYNNNGNYNTGIGAYCMYNMTTGTNNTASGYKTMYNNSTGSSNVVFGNYGFNTYDNSTVNFSNNIGIGNYVGYNVTGDNNIFFGYKAGASDMTTLNAAHDNICAGYLAGNGTRLGSFNILIGRETNFDTSLSTFDYCILLGSYTTASDTHQIRIGFDQNQNSVQTRTFIQAIRDKTTESSNTLQLYIDDTGKLGTTVSSRQFKTNIETLKSDTFYDFRPVTYNRILETGEARPEIEFGLIAEEVAKNHVDLVKYKQEKPFTVKYHLLCPVIMALFHDMNQQLLQNEYDDNNYQECCIIFQNHLNLLQVS